MCKLLFLWEPENRQMPTRGAMQIKRAHINVARQHTGDLSPSSPESNWVGRETPNPFVLDLLCNGSGL